MSYCIDEEKQTSETILRKKPRKNPKQTTMQNNHHHHHQQQQQQQQHQQQNKKNNTAKGWSKEVLLVCLPRTYSDNPRDKNPTRTETGDKSRKGIGECMKQKVGTSLSGPPLITPGPRWTGGQRKKALQSASSTSQPRTAEEHWLNTQCVGATLP